MPCLNYNQKPAFNQAHRLRRESARSSSDVKRKYGLRKFFLLSTLAFGLAWLSATTARASVTVTPATSGLNISADKAQNATSPAFTTLGNIDIAEGSATDFATGTSVTLILT